MSAPALRRLKLRQFRSYRALTLTLPDKPLFVSGPNGAGKTNLLEAVSLLTVGTGMRRAKLTDIARQNSPGAWSLDAQITFAGLPDVLQVTTGVDPSAPSKRVLAINGAPVTHHTDLLMHLAVVWLVPQMSRFFFDGDSYRRRFLDQTACLFVPSHRRHLSQYERALRERTALLARDASQNQWCEGLEATLAEVGTTIAATRRDVVRRLNALLGKGFLQPLPACELHLQGTLEESLADQPALAVEESFAGVLRESRPDDAQAARLGHSSRVGPHRSAFELRCNGIAGVFCSTGEQKTMILALALATAHLLEQQTGRPPLLLLDDALAHLDGANRSALLAYVRARVGQTWLTSTHPTRHGAFAHIRADHSTLTIEGA